VSVVVPAHNEAELLPGCLESIRTAEAASRLPVEIVVVDNRSDDGTATIATSAGAAVVASDARNIARVRNQGVAASTGRWVVTLDADCRMAANSLVEVARHLDDGRFVGGGTKVVPDRRSLGISLTYGLTAVVTAVTGLSGGMFWCARRDFDAVGGFDESLLVAEDLDFARRLRAHGRKDGRRLTMLRNTQVVASTRKFDRFGDWHMFAMARELPAIRRAARGIDTAWVDRYFFDFNDDGR
jgi:glycosyltransferase involved in cell wall biosynthesis